MLVVLLCLLVTVRTQYEELVKEQGSENLITRSEELDITRSEELDITEAQGILTEIEEIFRGRNTRKILKTCHIGKLNNQKLGCGIYTYVSTCRLTKLNTSEVHHRILI